jgi:hypothetical protein
MKDRCSLLPSSIYIELTTAASTDAATRPKDPEEADPENRKASKHKMLIIDRIRIPKTTHNMITYGNMRSRLYCKKG